MGFLVNLLISLPARIASYFSWAGPLVARLVVGYVFMLSGWTKLNNLPTMIERFTEWGIPAPQILTPFVSGVECFGGAMLILGLFTRIPAAMLAVVNDDIAMGVVFDAIGPIRIEVIARAYLFGQRAKVRILYFCARRTFPAGGTEITDGIILNAPHFIRDIGYITR